MGRIQNVVLHDREGVFDIWIEGGRITQIANVTQIVNSNQPVHLESHGDVSHEQVLLNGGGTSLVIPGFVDAHVHMDKALLSDRCCAKTGTFGEALELTAAAKRNFTVEDIQQRATRVLESAISFGTTLMRSHCEVDEMVGLQAVQAILQLKQQYSWAIDLQVAAFAQENIADEGKLMRQALEMGCSVVGSAPYCDTDPKENIRLMFSLAGEFDVDVDFHLDYHLNDRNGESDGPPSLLEYVIEQTILNNYQGRVCLGHCTVLSSYDPAQLVSIGTKLKEAGISLLALPASDVYMMARDDTEDRRRGVAPVDVLAELGVTASFATNNVQNLFTFTGDGDMLKIATLSAQILQIGSRKGHRDLLTMATSLSAQCIRCHNHRIAVGQPADLVVLTGCPSATNAIAAPPPTRVVIKRGVIVAESKFASQIFPPSCATSTTI